MALRVLNYQSEYRLPAQTVFEWHKRPGALQRLSPPWVKVRLLSSDVGLKSDVPINLEIRMCGVPIEWKVKHDSYQEGAYFSDVQLSGPFASWRHEHIFNPVPNGVDYLDRVSYRLPFSWVSDVCFNHWVQKQLQRMFRYRHEILGRDLSLSWLKGRDVSRKRILVTGASGFIGKALIPYLQTQGHEVIALTHDPFLVPTADKVLAWDPDKGIIPFENLEGMDAVVHLAGASLMGRWTKKKMKAIYNSRIGSTRFLCEKLAQLKHPPKVLVTASGVSYYGTQGPKRLCTEESMQGTGFLAHVVRDWEGATQVAKDKGIRVVNLRAGSVLSPEGGSMGLLLSAAFFGLSAAMGPKKCLMPWISRDDFMDMVYYSILNEGIEGPVNAVAPEVISNGEFARALSKATGYPAWMKVPLWSLRLALGNMVKEVLMSDLEVVPEKLVKSGFTYRYPTIKSFFEHLMF